MADKSITHPREIVEDVLVKVDKFIFPIDFTVLETEEDFNVPLILERPFLVMRRNLGLFKDYFWVLLITILLNL